MDLETKHIIYYLLITVLVKIIAEVNYYITDTNLTHTKQFYYERNPIAILYVLLKYLGLCILGITGFISFTTWFFTL